MREHVRERVKEHVKRRKPVVVVRRHSPHAGASKMRNDDVPTGFLSGVLSDVPSSVPNNAWMGREGQRTKSAASS